MQRKEEYICDSVLIKHTKKKNSDGFLLFKPRYLFSACADLYSIGDQSSRFLSAHGYDVFESQHYLKTDKNVKIICFTLEFFFF